MLDVAGGSSPVFSDSRRLIFAISRPLIEFRFLTMEHPQVNTLEEQ